MAIASAVQQGSSVYVYNERNGVMFVRPGTLVGYTQDTVSVERDSTVFTYDANNKLIGSRRKF